MRPLLSLLMVLALSAATSSPVLAFFGPARVIKYIEGVVVKDPSVDPRLQKKYRVVLLENPGTPEETRFLIHVPMMDIRAMSLMAKMEQTSPTIEPGSTYPGVARIALSGTCMSAGDHHSFELIGQAPSSAELTAEVMRQWKARAHQNEHGAAEALKVLEDQGLLQGMVQDLLKLAR